MISHKLSARVSRVHADGTEKDRKREKEKEREKRKTGNINNPIHGGVRCILHLYSRGI